MSWHITTCLTVGACTLDLSMDAPATPARPVAIIGPNGAGKTTLLRVVAGAHPEASGRVVVGGAVWQDSATRTWTPPERRRVGYVPQGHGLFPHLSVRDNVAFALRPDDPNRAARRAAALEHLDRLELGHLASRRPAALSGGERQRVALARALARDPALLLLDEPLASLDITARHTVRAQLAAHLSTRQLPALIVTHDPRDVRALDAEVVVIEAGGVVQRGEAEALARAPATPFVAAFFDGFL